MSPILSPGEMILETLPKELHTLLRGESVIFPCCQATETTATV